MLRDLQLQGSVCFRLKDLGKSSFPNLSSVTNLPRRQVEMDQMPQNAAGSMGSRGLKQGAQRDVPVLTNLWLRSVVGLRV